MSTPFDAQDGRRAVLRDALVRLEEMRARLHDLEGAHTEPIAIVGMALLKGHFSFQALDRSAS